MNGYLFFLLRDLRDSFQTLLEICSIFVKWLLCVRAEYHSSLNSAECSVMSGFSESNENVGGVAILTSVEARNKRKKKFTGGNASKRHRDRVNIEFNNLAQLLPFPESVIAKLDKSSILRLAVSYIRAKSFFKDTVSASKEELVTNTGLASRNSSPTDTERIQEGTGLVSEIFSQALDGFLLVLTEDMKVLFVSESVRDYLGYCQAGIIHEIFLQFVNQQDHHIIESNMRYRPDEVESKHKVTPQQAGFTNGRHAFTNEQMRGFDLRGHTQSVVSRRFICRMKCAFSCSSRFYTAYRTFQFSGHLRRSTIQEGREQKYLNTLVVFATPAATGSSASIDGVSDIEEKPTLSYNSAVSMERGEYIAYHRYTSGFRIEPTLRPHIAPIPVSSNEPTERGSSVATTTHIKSRPAPSSIPDIYHREPFIISHNNLSSYLQKGYPVPVSSEYSDHSDDSKCSPASSPNLIWKQRRPPSPLSGQYANRPELCKPSRNQEILQKDLDGYRRNSILEIDYHRMRQRASPDFFRREVRTKVCESNMDVFVGASMLMNLRQNVDSPTNSSKTTERENRKRHSDDLVNRSVILPKRNRCPNETRCHNFNISSLLGLEENQTKKSCKNDHMRNINKDEVIDNRKIDERNDKLISYDDIFQKMSKNLDQTFHKTMTPHIFQKMSNNFDQTFHKPMAHATHL